MSEKLALPTEDDALESPDEAPKPKGLVPRSSIFIGLLVFVLILAVMAAVDIFKSGGQPKGSQAPAEKTKADPKKKDLGPTPVASDIKLLADQQTLRSSPAPVRPALPGAQYPDDGMPNPDGSAPLPTGGMPREKAGAVMQTTNGSPVGSGTIGYSSGSSPQVAQGAASTAERRALAAESDVFAIQPSSGAANDMKQQAATLRDSLADFASRGAPPVADPADAIARALMQGQGQVSVDDANTQFMKQMDKGGIAPATYAQAPVSHNMVFQGTRIPVITREGINSDLPGQLTATSTTPIYDGIDQCRELIPAGTKFIGQYSALIKPGQVRVMSGFKRLIMPNGFSVDLGSAGTADTQGAAGIEGDVDNHFMKMFGYSLAIALIADQSGGEAQYSVTQPNGQTTTTTIAGQVLGQTATQIMSRNANIAPTITVPPGTPLFVTLVRDITLKPVRNLCRR